jgi:hypothetical protein
MSHHLSWEEIAEEFNKLTEIDNSSELREAFEKLRRQMEETNSPLSSPEIASAIERMQREFDDQNRALAPAIDGLRPYLEAVALTVRKVAHPLAPRPNGRSQADEVSGQPAGKPMQMPSPGPTAKTSWTEAQREIAAKLVAEKDSVSTLHAAQFLNCSVQHVLRLVRKKKLIASGTRPKVVTSASLQAYKWPKRSSMDAGDHT